MTAKKKKNQQRKWHRSSDIQRNESGKPMAKAAANENYDISNEENGENMKSVMKVAKNNGVATAWHISISIIRNSSKIAASACIHQRK